MATYQEKARVESPAVEELLEFLSSRPEVGESTFEEFEADLHERICAVEREQLAAELERYDVGADRIEVKGKMYRRKLDCEQSYLGQGGEFRVQRWLYVPCQGEGLAICPAELRAGIVGKYCTPRAAKIAATGTALMTPRECSELFAEQGGMQPSTSTLDRLPKTLSKCWEKNRAEFESELRCSTVIPADAVALVISLDGVQALMKDEGRAEKRSQEDKRPMGPAGYREVACATLSFVDLEGETIETIRYARMPQEGKVDVKAWLKAEAKTILESTPGLDVVFVSDGARDLWEFADELERDLGIEDMHRALDAYHALERLKQALDAYHGEGSAKSRGAFEEFRQRLTDEPGGVESVLRGLRYRRGRCNGTARKTIDCQIKYFERGKDRMGYAALKERNLPIGSGIVEATCKTLVTQRMKRSGMSWREPGGQAILTIRSLLQSNRWRQGWELLAAEFVIPVSPAA